MLPQSTIPTRHPKDLRMMKLLFRARHSINSLGMRQPASPHEEQQDEKYPFKLAAKHGLYRMLFCWQSTNRHTC